MRQYYDWLNYSNIFSHSFDVGLGSLTMKRIFLVSLSVGCISQLFAQSAGDIQQPSREEIITPIRKASFNNNNECPERRQGGNPQQVNGYLTFNGSMDGNRQVDPQIAVGGGYVLHGTNSGLVIYDKKGAFVQGVSQKCFNDGIDPKMYFDIHNKMFVFDLWWYYDKEKIKPVNISVSETSDPTGAWNTYPVPAPKGVDGGGIGYSKKWIGYTFPGGTENTFVLSAADAKAGKPAKVYHFTGDFGQPVFTQDDMEDLYFIRNESNNFVIRKITADANGKPYCQVVSTQPHQLSYNRQPPQSMQRGTAQKVSSGDRNPKNAVLQNNCIWFSQAVERNGRSAVQWHQINASSGAIIQTGSVHSDTTNYIQTTLAVNRQNDVLVGFQEVNENSFISPRFAYRLQKDKPGTLRKVVRMGEGRGATDGVAWGDYSGSIIDADDLLSMWTIQSIANEKGRGETIITKVPFKKKRKR